ncbi:hypothetical protein ACT8ZV_11240 [Nocardioides sp. MAHUQ-72]
MADHVPGNGDESAMVAFLFALLLDAAIIGLFLFITWLAYATD